MELKKLLEKVVDIFSINDASELGEALFLCVRNNETDKYEQFRSLVGDLSVDWMQKIFQYYCADRKNKKQDYTPKTLADFMGRLAGNSETIIDMCAGSGALTIQKWNRNPCQEFLMYEFDEKVIPYLLFNMAVRNIPCTVYHSDVLRQEVFHVYKIKKGNPFGVFEEAKKKNGDIAGFKSTV